MNIAATARPPAGSRFAVAGALATAWALLVAALGWPRYETVDDILLARLIANGDPPVFFGQVPGRLVALLGATGLGELAYPLFLLAANTLALALVLHWLLAEGRRAFGPRLAALAALIVAALFVRFFLRFSFTSSGLLLCAGLLLQLFSDAVAARPARAALIGLGLGIAFLVRAEAGALAFILLAPLALHRWFVLRRRAWASLALAAAGFLATLGLETLLVKRLPADHQAYLEYNAVRGRLNTTRMLDHRSRLADTLAANGWHPSDYDMFQNWLQADEEAFNPRTLGVLLDNLTRERTDTREALQPARLLGMLRDQADVFLLLAAATAAGLLASRRPGVLLAAGAGGAAIALLLVLFVWIRLPRRVADPAAVAAAVCVLGVLGGGAAPAVLGWRAAPLRALAALALLVFTLAHLARYDLTLRADNRALQAEHNDREARYARVLAGRPALIHNREMCLGMQGSPFRPADRPFIALEFSWNYQSPGFYRAIRQQLGVERGRDLYPALVDHPRAAFVAQQEIIDLLLRNLRERHGIDARADELGEPLGATRFVRLTRIVAPTP